MFTAKILAIAATMFFGAASGAPAATEFTGDLTWFNPGLGACGAHNVDSDLVVALSPAEYAGGAHCFQHIGIHANGQFVDATVVDLCTGCASGSIDLSPAAFQHFAPLSVGRIHGATWAFE